MKLLFCVFKYFPFGGMQKIMLRIAETCQQRGHQVEICALEWQGEAPSGINVIILPSKSFTNHSQAQDFAHAVALQKTKTRYDLTVGFNKMPGLDIYYAGDICYKEKAFQEKNWFYRLTPRYRTYAQFEQAVFDKTAHTHILLIADAEKKHFIKHYQTEVERFYLLPPGISKNCIPPENVKEIRAQYRAKLGLKEDEQLVLFVGSGFKTKGLDRAILALQSLPKTLQEKTFLLAIGEDNPKPFLSRRQNVQILKGRNDIPCFLWSADVLIHPAYHETAGAVLLEAMIAGLPVLTTDSCGFSPYVLDANAGKVIASPYQQEKLNQALAEMLTSPERKVWQKNGLQLAYTHDLFSRAEKAVDFIECYGGRDTTL